ncbi:hypothetical protein [Streptomyces sp. NPDC050507]|uniref:hypothetical protein n=1 Tax=Streptomyces sp. NPDC050507 TaxID=3365619 RepID=UPI0037ABACCB
MSWEPWPPAKECSQEHPEVEDIRMVHMLVKKLINKTEQGRLEWSHEENPIDPWAERGSRNTRSSTSTFTVSLTRGTISIWSVDGDDLHPYTLQVRGERGQVVEEVETPRLNAEDEHAFTPLQNDIKDLYLSARRNALNIDAVLRQMLNDLDDR